MGDKNHKSTDDDEDLLILEISKANKHPLFDGKSSYYHVAVLTTRPVDYNEVSSVTALYF